MAAEKSNGYAVVGLGSIARDAVLPAFEHSSNATLVAVVSGDKQKAKRFAKDFHASRAYSYDEFQRLSASDEWVASKSISIR